MPWVSLTISDILSRRSLFAASLAATGHSRRNPENTVFDAKRLIGRKFADPIVQAKAARRSSCPAHRPPMSSAFLDRRVPSSQHPSGYCPLYSYVTALLQPLGAELLCARRTSSCGRSRWSLVQPFAPHWIPLETGFPHTAMPEHRGAGDKPIIVISVGGEEKKFHPEEVSSDRKSVV